MYESKKKKKSSFHFNFFLINIVFLLKSIVL